MTEKAKSSRVNFSSRIVLRCIVIMAVLTGFEAVRYLIAPPKAMTGHAVVALLGLCACVWLVLRLKKRFLRLAALGLFLVSVMGGYLLACVYYLDDIGHKQAPIIVSAQAPSSDHTAVIYFTHGEPRTYEGSFVAWKHAIHEMDETGVPFVPWIFRPFFFKKLRDEYFEVGGSFHNLIHNRIMERLEAAYRHTSQTSMRFYIAYSDDAPMVDEVAAHAINEGASRVILLNVWMTDSDHSEQGRKTLEELQLEKYGVQLCVTDTLWESRRLMRMYVDRALAASTDMPRADVGVLLVAHGQPATWDALFKKQPVQENAFRYATKKLLVEEGFQEGKIALAYMEFKQPDIRASVKDLLAAGVKKILVAPVNISTDSIHSEHEIPSMVSEAIGPISLPVEHLGAWNDDQQLLDALIEQLDVCGA